MSICVYDIVLRSVCICIYLIKGSIGFIHKYIINVYDKFTLILYTHTVHV